MTTLEDTGIYKGIELEGKIFYGFKLTNADGNGSVDIIDGGTLVKLPDDGYTVGPNDYLVWFWATSNFRFEWGEKGHLKMVCV